MIGSFVDRIRSLLASNQRSNAMRGLALCCFFLILNPVYASIESLGPGGINSLGLQLPNGNPLTGNGFSIGQVETQRPGKTTIDDGSNSNSFIAPADVFVFDHAPLPNLDIKVGINPGHAQAVASVMISTDEAYPGVARGASLYASAFRTASDPTYSSHSDAILVAVQHIARADNNDVAAINHSYALTDGTAHGNSQITLGLDWIARVNNVLNVTAMPNKRTFSDPFWYHPFDDFNGVTVARSTRVGDTYTLVSDLTEFVTPFNQNRTFIDIIAPGDDIDIRHFDETPINRSGNSYAAPHVTGTVALLQEYGEARAVIPHLNRWTFKERHEVMKAVLLNSADKIKDDGATIFNGQAVPVGGFLGMEKTLLDTNGNNWLASEAMTDDLLPLDDEMGAGHLNAKRAIQQFGGGRYSPDLTPVPLIGWDYGMTQDQEDINKYVFEEELMGKSFVSITLAWD